MKICRIGIAWKAAIGLAALLFLFIVTVQAVPAITSFSVDRNTVDPGQTIQISVRTTAQANYVFATLDGVRTQGVRINTDAQGNHNWLINVTPVRSTNILVFVNSINSESGAASVSMPVTVVGTVGGVAAVPGIPTVAAPIGAVAVAHVVETPPLQAGQVALTVVTGLQANYVWVEFDRLNNQRDTGSFARGEMVSQDRYSRTWVVRFTPRVWAPQLVQVGANRTYVWPGAGLHNHQLTLQQTFVPGATIGTDILNVNITPQEVPAGGDVTLRITTTAATDFVWVRDMDGRETNARSIAPNTTTQRTWEVVLTPSRSGQVTVFANTNRTVSGASQSQHTVNVHGGAAVINQARAVNLGGNNARVTVQTNQHVNSVWVTMGTGTNLTRFPLPRQGTGTGTRTWEAELANVQLPVRVFASEFAGHTAAHDVELSVANFGTGWTTPAHGGWVGGDIWSGHIHQVDMLTPAARWRGDTVDFLVTTGHAVSHLRVQDPHGYITSIVATQIHFNPQTNTRQWLVSATVHSSAPRGSWRNFPVDIRVNSGNWQLDQARTPTLHIQ